MFLLGKSCWGQKASRKEMWAASDLLSAFLDDPAYLAEHHPDMHAAAYGFALYTLVCKQQHLSSTTERTLV